MPKEIFDRDYRFLPHAELLSFEEITRLARAFMDNGVEKMRLTGGEPLLRKDLHKTDRDAGAADARATGVRSTSH